MRTVMVFLILLLAVPALAGPPLNGTYKSTDLAGAMLMGRESESWNPMKWMNGNTINAESWDGMTLGTQWKWFCPWQTAAPQLILDTVDGNGNGQKKWLVMYGGGVCWLDGAGPWGNGDPDYTADINTWTDIITETYANNVLTGSIRNTSAVATFRNYNSDCMSLQISNYAWVGDTGAAMMKPMDYPEFYFHNPCGGIGHAGPGEWGDVSQITFSIVDCSTVPTEEKTWGSIKSLYKD